MATIPFVGKKWLWKQPVPPTPTELVPLIEAKSVLRGNWVGSHDKDINEANYQAHQRQWHEWIATADAAWLPSLVTLALNPPIVPGDDYLRDTWAMDLAQIFGVIAKTHPFLVVETLADALDANGEPQAIVVAFRWVGEALHALPDTPDNQSVKMTSLNKIVAVLAPLVDRLIDKPDDYAIDLVDTLGEGIRQPSQELLHRIVSVVPQDRVAVHREVALFLEPDELAQAAT